VRTQVKGKQVLDQSISRDDINVSTQGQALITKLVLGDNLSATSTGIDSGTGDVTLNLGFKVIQEIRDPIETDDSLAGYTLSSSWINTVTKNEFICVDVTNGNAVWKKTTNIDDIIALSIALG